MLSIEGWQSAQTAKACVPHTAGDETSAGGLGSPIEGAEHDVEADVAVLGVAEGTRHGPDDLEAERLPELDGNVVRLDDGVELNACVSLLARPLHHVVAQRTPDSAAAGSRTDHEARGGDV